MGSLTQSEKLRQEARTRINSGEFTTLKLARLCGVSQPHLSNFLNRRKSFSQKNLDSLSLILEFNTEPAKDSSQSSKRPRFQLVPIVSQRTAIEVVRITPKLVIGKTRFGISIDELDPKDILPGRSAWTRLVAVQPTPAQLKFMHPAVSSQSLIVIDRHDQKLDRLIAGMRDLYALSSGTWLSIGHLRRINGRLMLVADANTSDPEDITTAPTRGFTHSVVGRVYGIWNSQN